MIRRAFFITLIFAAALPSVAVAQRRDSVIGTNQLQRPALTLRDAINRALNNGDEARIARAQTDITRAQVTTAFAGGLPQIRLTGSQVHQLESARAQAVGSIFFQPLTYNATATLTQPVFQGGKVFAGMRAAGALKHASELNEKETRAQVIVDVQRAYMQALFSRKITEIQQASYNLAADRVKQTEQFQNAGRAARYDVLRARVELANIEPLLIQARNDEKIALLELKRLANIPANQSIQLSTDIDSSAISFAVSKTDSTQISFNNRASIKAAELNTEARKAGVTAARADYYPSLSFNAALGRQAFPQSGFPTKSGKIEDGEQNGGWFGDRSVGFSVSWPILDVFRIKGSVALAKAQLEIAKIQTAQTRENVANEVASAAAELERAKSTYDARRESVKEAEEAFSLASLRFSRGLSTQLEVSDAQLALTTARTNSARAIYDLYLAASALERAQGKPIPLPDGTTIDPDVTNQ